MSEHVNVYEAKTHFSHWVEAAEAGQEVIICKRNRPVAVLSPFREPGRVQRQIGLAKGTFALTPAFFEPLPDDFVDLFDGKGS